MHPSDLPHPSKDESGTPSWVHRSEKGPSERTIRRAGSLGLSVVVLLSALIVTEGAVPASFNASNRITPLASTFSFGAAGDYSFSSEAQAVMMRMGDSGLDFILALGDLSYGDATELEWCSYFEAQVGDGRALLIAGNHDEGGSDGDINVFRQHCNFDIAATLSGDYAKEYYFDYPASGPLVRFILSSCGLDLDNTSWACAPGDAHYSFLSNAIDDARAASIPWVIVGMHKNCITNGDKECAIGEAVQDLLLEKKVDLVLQGHEHAYLRSRRLVCADDDLFRPECLAPTGGWGQVIAIVGTGGKGSESLGGTLDEPYFETWSGDTFGFLKVDVSGTALDARFVPVDGTYTDSFQISRSSQPPDFTLSVRPMSVSVAPDQPGFVNVAVDATSGFDGTVDLSIAVPEGVTGSCVPTSLRAQETSTCALSGQTPGSYVVTITGTSGSVIRAQNIALSIAQPSPGPDSTPPLVAIASPANNTLLRSGTVTVTGRASDDTGVQSVELSSDGVSWIPATGTDAWTGSLTLPGGEHLIQVRATDAAGNVGTAVVQVSVNLTLPAPFGFLDLSWPNLAVYAGIALAVGLAGGAILRLVRRRGDGRPPSR
jgi:Big-like domain-containing protein/calcineurin-like phosphoesterase family protein